MDYLQSLDPLATTSIFGLTVPWSVVWSTVFAGLPVLVLFWFLVPQRWLAPKAGAMGALAAILIAVIIYGMPIDMTLWSFVHGAGFGLLPVGWTIFNAMLLYNITVETGQFTIIRRSVASLSGDARIQSVLIGFSFGAFLEGAAGGGTPVAICGAIMVGLGFNPFLAAVLCLIANTSPVAYGGLGTPIMVLSDVTNLDGKAISTMAGHQLPFLSLLVPAYMVRCMCSWKQTFAVWPALLVSGGSFAGFQFVFATIHEYLPNLVLYPMTDIGGGIFSLVVTAIFLMFWKPANEWHFTTPTEPTFSAALPPTAITTQTPSAVTAETPAATPSVALDPNDPHAAEAMALLGGGSKPSSANETKPLTAGNVALAWTPFIIMSVLLMLTGIVREMEGKRGKFKEHDAQGQLIPLEERKEKHGPIYVPGTKIETNYLIEIPTLHNKVIRPDNLRPRDKHGNRIDEPESAKFNFAWLTAPGTAVFLAALLSMLMLRMSGPQIGAVVKRTFVQMKIPIPTICFMLGLSYVTRYAGMDATLGVAFANTGFLYPFFAAILGWLGVFLTGTDAGSNALFGSLQKITATQIHNAGAFGTEGLSVGQAQVLICTANSTGGVMGKMIDAQSICVATAATAQLGKEADIFKAVVWHSIVLASIVGLLTLLQAYVFPFTGMVPSP
ncbi:MAG: L-lactate permease [Planctomycetes bacterium]|nr:L-lactate permease [Planctomycetota bacterium]